MVGQRLVISLAAAGLLLRHKHAGWDLDRCRRGHALISFEQRRLLVFRVCREYLVAFLHLSLLLPLVRRDRRLVVFQKPGRPL